MILFVCVGVMYSGEYDVCGVTLSSAFFKEFSLGGQNRKKMQNEKFEPSRFG
jgi:hypothetical protein